MSVNNLIHWLIYCICACVNAESFNSLLPKQDFEGGKAFAVLNKSEGFLAIAYFLYACIVRAHALYA